MAGRARQDDGKAVPHSAVGSRFISRDQRDLRLNTKIIFLKDFYDGEVTKPQTLLRRAVVKASFLSGTHSASLRSLSILHEDDCSL